MNHIRKDHMNIILGITGGIAAYKTPSIAAALVSNGHTVKCVCTKSALMFVTEMSLATMSKNPVVTSLEDEVQGVVTHIEMTEWCDVFAVVPCTANFIGKVANGIADDTLSTMYLAAFQEKDIRICPAMNSNMWEHYKVKDNLEEIHSRGVEVLEPAVGMLACGVEGKGKLPSTRKVVEFIQGEAS